MEVEYNMKYNPIDYEEYNPNECTRSTNGDSQFLDPILFTEDSPVFDNVKVIQMISRYDGVLSGICEIHEQKFYFNHIVDDIWRYYNKQTKIANRGKKYQLVSRLWRIFAVYDVKLEVLENAKLSTPKDYYDFVSEQEYNVIGIFFNYTWIK